MHPETGAFLRAEFYIKINLCERLLYLNVLMLIIKKVAIDAVTNLRGKT